MSREEVPARLLIVVALSGLENLPGSRLETIEGMRATGGASVMGEATERTDGLESADAETLVGRGFDWLSAGEPDRAIEEFDASLLLDPEHGKAFFGRGQAWRAKGELARSLRDLDEAVRLKPDDPSCLATGPTPGTASVTSWEPSPTSIGRSASHLR